MHRSILGHHLWSWSTAAQSTSNHALQKLGHRHLAFIVRQGQIQQHPRTILTNPPATEHTGVASMPSQRLIHGIDKQIRRIKSTQVALLECLVVLQQRFTDLADRTFRQHKLTQGAFQRQLHIALRHAVHIHLIDQIPKKQLGKWRALGIPCFRDRVVHSSAMLVLSPIFEADLQPEQYAYRAQRSANDAFKRVHSLLNTGHHEVVDADLSNYFGEIPHAELMKSIARRVSDGRMLGLIKSWLVMPVQEDDGKGGKRRTNRAKKERKGTPQGCPISPLLSNIYMRRFILGWKQLGYARRFHAEIVNYADDICILGKMPATEMLLAVNRIMNHLKLPVNVEKTRCLRCPEEPLEFLGYRIGTNYRQRGKDHILVPVQARRALRVYAVRLVIRRLHVTG